MGRGQKRPDPLRREQSYSYDPNGNLASFPDRNGKVTTFRYDHRNHKTFAGFGTTGNPPAYESTINYTYYIIGLLTQIADSFSANVTHSYHPLNPPATQTLAPPPPLFSPNPL